jgi:hypothetical protein
VDIAVEQGAGYLAVRVRGLLSLRTETDLRGVLLKAAAEQPRGLVCDLSEAEDLWGVRREEALGRHLLALDIGLPLEQLTPVLREVLADGSRPDGDGAAGPATPQLQLTALNRRGRSVDVRVSTTPLVWDGATVAGAIVVVDLEGQPAWPV